MALMTAIALPPLLLIGVGAVELQGVASDQAATQNVANQAALWGAQQLGVTPVGVEARTESWASPQLQDILARADVKVSASVQQGALMRVAIDTHRPSFFMNLMPAGGFSTHAEATAQSINRLPLCVLTFGAQTGDQARLSGAASIKATSCMVHARGDIKLDPAASITAGMVETESSKAQGGVISPTAGTGAPAVPDPFASLAIAFPSPCTSAADKTVDALNPLTLQPAAGAALVVPYKINVKPGGVLTLKPGEYYFCSDVTAQGGPLATAQQTALGPASAHGLAGPKPPGLIGAVTNPLTAPAADTASIVGADVVAVFADNAKFDLRTGSSVTLNGRKSGPLAGFVLVGGLTTNGDFLLNADQIQSLLGTVYIRQAVLHLQGNLKMTAAAAWTVIVANQLKLDTAAPGIIINANYATSDVPRPTGVGDAASSTNSRLVR
ncbi:MAG: hypothetical protein INR64_01580 [Caulobacteraceae bacterium]|nr:hypothetical protein [Caulobacter sp.]